MTCNVDDITWTTKTWKTKTWTTKTWTTKTWTTKTWTTKTWTTKTSQCLPCETSSWLFLMARRR